MTSAHVDLVQIATWTGDTGLLNQFVDTGIALPAAGIDALVVQASGRTSAVFSEERLNTLERAAAGDEVTPANSLPLSEIGVSLDFVTNLGCSAPTSAAPWGTLLIAYRNGGTNTVTLWHLEPADVTTAELTADTAARLAPPLTAETRGRYLQQSPTGETLVFAADPPPIPAGDAYATPEAYRARNRSSEQDDDLVAEALTASARHLDWMLGLCPGGLSPLPERTLTFWPRRRPSRVLWPRDAEGRLWPLRDISTIAFDYAGTGTPERTVTFADCDWIVGHPHNSPPWRSLRILEAHRDAPYSVWPSDPGTATLVASPGHDTTPPSAVELVIHTAREILDGHLGGAAAVFAALDDPVAMNTPMAALWRNLKREHGVGRPSLAGVVASAASRPR